MDAAIALLVFVLTYALIVSEKVHRAIVALLGGMILILFGVLSQETALEHIDWNTLGLLVGMMIIVGITQRTGVFQYLALKAVRIAKGEPIRILILLGIVTAVLSAFLDNVTTVLLIVPVTLKITDSLGVDPVPYLMTQIMASNIGGTATLIGDPPNIMIGSQTGLSFMDFLVNLGPVVVVILAVTLGILYFIYRNKLQVPESVKQEVCRVNPRDEIKDYALLKKSLLILGLVILGFILHDKLHLESATIALTGAALLMLVARVEPEDILLSVEWPTIFFFIGLFIVVGGLVETGLIDLLAQKSLEVTAGDLRLTGVLILWLSAIASAFVDNIPFVATMIPLIQEMGNLGGISGQDMESLWWALSLGACLGGNGTLIGASANVIVVGIAEKNGIKIRFLQFMKLAFPLMLISVAIAMGYLLLFYL